MSHKIYWTKPWKRVTLAFLGIVKQGAYSAIGVVGGERVVARIGGIGRGRCEVAGNPPEVREKPPEEALVQSGHTPPLYRHALVRDSDSYSRDVTADERLGDP